jgi:ribosomal-protein-alanine N-acetyltransferase
MPDPETSRLQFRRFTPDDLHALAAIRADPEVMKHISSRRPESVEEVETGLNKQLAHWDHHGFGRWALIDKGSGTLVGWCGLFHLENTDEVEIGYAFAREYWGKGLASEAARAAMKYGFEVLRLRRIVAVAWPENTASLRVMEKLGMTKTPQLYADKWVYYLSNSFALRFLRRRISDALQASQMISQQSR